MGIGPLGALPSLDALRERPDDIFRRTTFHCLSTYVLYGDAFPHSVGQLPQSGAKMLARSSAQADPSKGSNSTPVPLRANAKDVTFGRVR